jgi:hypothetical protein
MFPLVSAHPDSLEITALVGATFGEQAPTQWSAAKTSAAQVTFPIFRSLNNKERQAT